MYGQQCPPVRLRTAGNASGRKERPIQLCPALLSLFHVFVFLSDLFLFGDRLKSGQQRLRLVENFVHGALNKLGPGKKHYHCCLATSVPEHFQVNSQRPEGGDMHLFALFIFLHKCRHCLLCCHSAPQATYTVIKRQHKSQQ